VQVQVMMTGNAGKCSEDTDEGGEDTNEGGECDNEGLSMFLYSISWKKNLSESHSNDIVALCHYRYSCWVCCFRHVL
jgi:hypothetical protein